MKPNRKLRGQGQGHRGKHFGVHGKVMFYYMFLPNITGIDELVCEQFSKPKRRFWNFNAESEVMVNVIGLKEIDEQVEVLSQGMCVLNIKGVAQLVLELRYIFKT